jgi:putative inorganic carbon (HCO3(-)) transporter
MTIKDELRTRPELFLACAAAVAGIFSIAASHILLGAAILAIIVKRQKLQAPAYWLPLALFLGWTVLSLLVSAEPARGLPQIKKFYVFSIVFVLATVLKRKGDARWFALAMGGAAAISAIWAVVQYIVRANGVDDAGFYRLYVADRISGFMSHWMTFGGQMMIAFLLLLAFVFFAREKGWLVWAAAASISVMGIAMLLSGTRSIWLGTGVGAAYLIWCWRKWMLLATPLLIGLVIVASPGFVQERIQSIYKPHGDTDSNMHRYVCRQVGYAMIEAHPWFGLGPEQLGVHFKDYIPADIKRPLPEGYYGHLHNIYVQFAAERGIPALLFLLWMLAMILRDFFRAVGSSGEGKFLLQGAIAATLSILAAGVFEHNLGDSEVLMQFLAAVSIGYAGIPAASNS